MTSHASHKNSAPGEVFEFYMEEIVKIAYSKKPLSIENQIQKLKGRGLLFKNEETAKCILSNISYYRFRAYTYPFQDNENEENDHAFLQDDIYFEDIFNIYLFDRRLRLLVFNGIEKIEVAVRTKLSQIYSEMYNDSHWFLNGEHYKDHDSYEKIIKSIAEDVNRSNEDFIKHYKSKYKSPEMPASWMTLEVVSMGTLSRLYASLRKSDAKKEVARQFGLADVEIMTNWFHAFSNLRNCCAHHSRIWDGRFAVSINLPYNTTYPFMDRGMINSIKKNKLFSLLSCVKYICDIISPGNNFKTNLENLLKEKGDWVSLKKIGFPNEWDKLPVWK